MKHLTPTLALLILLGALLIPAVAQAPRAPFTVNSTADSVDAAPGNGVCADSLNRCTLRAAVMETNALAGADTIDLPAGNYTLTLTGTNENLAATGDLDVTGPLTLQSTSSNGFADTIIDGNQIDRVFENTSSFALTLNGLTITNGLASGVTTEGGAMRVASSVLNLQNSVISDSVGGNGGGVFCANGVLNISASEISGNMASGPSGSGGGILAGGCTLTLTNSGVRSNTAESGMGGGIGGFSAVSTTLTNVELSGNTAAGDGGGMNMRGGTQTLTNVRVAGNKAYNGGGLFLESSNPLTASGLQVLNNTAVARGGGLLIFRNTSANLIDASSFTGNSAYEGGGVFVYSALLILKNSTIAGNSAVYVGGGLMYDEQASMVGQLQARHTTLAYNSAILGSGVRTTTNNRVSFTNAIIWDNPSLVPISDCSGNVDSVGTNIALCGTILGIFTAVYPQFSPLKWSAVDDSPAVEVLAGSPAIGMGTANCEAADQRGLPRTAGACTLGATEFTGALELLANTGFEDDANGDKQPDSWTPLSLSGDKRKCIKPTKTVAVNSGICALTMKNATGAWRQKVAFYNLPEVGDEVLVAFWASATAPSAAPVVVVKIKGAGGQSEKVTVPLAFAASFFNRVSASHVLTFTPTKITVTIQWKPAAGKLVIDDVSLVNYDAGTRVRQMNGTLPPPPAPDGFRGSN